MSRIMLFWGWDADLIEVPHFVAENLRKYQRQFDKWISNPNNMHGYWSVDSEGERALSFNGDAFLKWINENVLDGNEEKAYLIEKEIIPNEEQMKLPRINF